MLILEQENGFRKDRLCIEPVFAKVQMIEKRTEINLPTFIIFIDHEKAFDRLERNKLWEIMFEKGFPEHIISRVKNLYVDTEITGKNGNKNVTK
jgi:hypothetical protein